MFLHSHGCQHSRAVRIFKTYGEQAIEKVRSNHTCCERHLRIGFATADQIARRSGFPRDSLTGAAGIDHVLLEATSDGLRFALAKLSCGSEAAGAPEGIVDRHCRTCSQWLSAA